MDPPSSLIVVSAEEFTPAVAMAADTADASFNEAPADSSSDSGSFDLEALYEASRGASELPGLRGLSVVGSSTVVNPNASTNVEPEQVSTEETPIGRDPLPRSRPGPQLRRRPALLTLLPAEHPIVIIGQTNSRIPFARGRSPGPPPDRPLPPLPHQRHLAAPNQGRSDVVQASFLFAVVPRTPSLTNSSGSSPSTSEFDFGLLNQDHLPSFDSFRGSFRNLEYMEFNENMEDNDNITEGDHAPEERALELPETRRDIPRRYGIEELLRLRHVANRPFDQLNLSEEVTTDHILRSNIVRNYNAVDLPSQGATLETRSRDPWMSDDEDMIFQGGAAVDNTRRSEIVSESPELWVPIRQPINPPEGVEAQQLHGFARFLRDHASPTHQRVTAGGRIVLVGPNSPPPTFQMGFIDEVLQRFSQAQMAQSVREGEEENHPKPNEKAGRSNNNPDPFANSGNGFTAGSARRAEPVGSTRRAEPTSNDAVNGVAANDQSPEQQVSPRGTLTLPPGAQPMLMAEDGTTIFHLGGSMFRAVLRGSQSFYELLTPVPIAGNVPTGDNTSQATAQETIMAMQPATPVSMAQPPMVTALHPMLAPQMANPVQETNNVQPMPQMATMQQFAYEPILPTRRPAMPRYVPTMTQSIVPARRHGQNLHHNSYAPSRNSLLQDSGRLVGAEISPLAVQLYNPNTVERSNRQIAIQIQIQNLETRLTRLMIFRSELEQQWALEEWQMARHEKTWNRDQLRQNTLQYDELRKLKKSLESILSDEFPGRTDFASSANIAPNVSRPGPREYAYNGRGSMRESFASTTSNDTYNSEATNMYHGTPGARQLQNPFSQSFPGNPRYRMAQTTLERNNAKPLSPNAPAFVPGGMRFSTSQMSQPSHHDSAAKKARSSEVSAFSSRGTSRAAMAGEEWPSIIDLNHPAREIEEADIKYCEESGFNDPTKPKKYCTTALELEWVVKNVRQQAKLLGCKKGSSKDPEWDAEQDIRHAVLVLRRPIPLAPMLPEFVRQLSPWDWEDSIFNVGPGVGPFWVAERYHCPPGAVQLEAQIDLWSHERLLLLEAKLARSRGDDNSNNFVLRDLPCREMSMPVPFLACSRRDSNTNAFALRNLARREMSMPVSSRRRSESVVSWDSDMARAADQCLASARNSDMQSLEPISQPRAIPTQDSDDSRFDVQSYRSHEQRNIAHLSSQHSNDNQSQNPATGPPRERRQVTFSSEESTAEIFGSNTQMKMVPVDGPPRNGQSNTLLRNMLDPGSKQKSDREFPPVKQTSSKENRPLQNKQAPGKSHENGPYAQPTGQKARSSLASPVFNAQGIVPSVTGALSASTYLSSNSGLQRQQGQAAGMDLVTESPSPRNVEARSVSGRRPRPGDYYRSSDVGGAPARNQNPWGHGVPHPRRG